MFNSFDRFVNARRNKTVSSVPINLSFSPLFGKTRTGRSIWDPIICSQLLFAFCLTHCLSHIQLKVLVPNAMIRSIFYFIGFLPLINVRVSYKIMHSSSMNQRQYIFKTINFSFSLLDSLDRMLNVTHCIPSSCVRQRSGASALLAANCRHWEMKEKNWWKTRLALIYNNEKEVKPLEIRVSKSCTANRRRSTG